jgi:hypothetical protein
MDWPMNAKIVAAAVERVTMPARKITKKRQPVKRARRGAKAGAAKKRVAVKPKRRGKSLLILECDAPTLASQGLSMAGQLQIVVRLAAPKVKTEVVQTSTKEDLLSRLGSLKQKQDSFSFIVVIGHSNVSGLNLTSDEHVSWQSFANWIAPFSPQKIALVACQAGRQLPAHALFNGIPTLKEIYAPPINTNKLQAGLTYLLKSDGVSF